MLCSNGLRAPGESILVKLDCQLRAVRVFKNPRVKKSSYKFVQFKISQLENIYLSTRYFKSSTCHIGISRFLKAFCQQSLSALRRKDQITSLKTIFEYISLKLFEFLMKLRQDSLYSWIQAISAFLFHAVFFGIAFSFGIFYVALLQEFPGQESEVGKLCFLILLLVFFWRCIIVFNSINMHMQIWAKLCCFKAKAYKLIPVKQTNL